MNAHRIATVGGLLLGAAGIATLWAGGVEFPVAVPPGIVILLTGALTVGLVHRTWTLGLGAFLGAFVTVGFLVSPTGIDNLRGVHGSVIAVGQSIQVIGVVIAAISGGRGFLHERRLHRREVASVGQP